MIRPVNIGRGDQFKPQFQAISPNNRMPAIVDPDGPGGRPISIFESGAILQYLGRKSGMFYPQEERARAGVDAWVFWQAANLGPSAGQRNHFRSYAPSLLPDQRQVAYGAIRFTNEVHRLYGVLERQLAGRDFIVGDYSIADMMTWPWVAARTTGALDIRGVSERQGLARPRRGPRGGAARDGEATRVRRLGPAGRRPLAARNPPRQQVVAACRSWRRGRDIGESVFNHMFNQAPL